jgi:hypothetical protein
MIYIPNILPYVQQHRTIKYPYAAKITMTFDNDSGVIIYALEMIIEFARTNQYLFVSNCVWGLAGVTGLDNVLTIHIDNLRKCEIVATSESCSGIVHPDRVQLINSERAVSPIPRDITEDQ